MVPLPCEVTLEPCRSLQRKPLLTGELAAGPALETSGSTGKTIHVASLWDGQGFALES